MRTARILTVCASLLLAACGRSETPLSLQIDGDHITGVGLLGYVDLEGGFTGITTIDHHVFIALAIPDDIAGRVGRDKPSLRIRFAGHRGYTANFGNVDVIVLETVKLL